MDLNAEISRRIALALGQTQIELIAQGVMREMLEAQLAAKPQEPSEDEREPS